MSTPTAPMRVTATSAHWSEWDRLKWTPDAPPLGSDGFARGAVLEGQRFGRASDLGAEDRRSAARPATNRRRWRSKTNRAARAVSSLDSSAAPASASGASRSISHIRTPGCTSGKAVAIGVIIEWRVLPRAHPIFDAVLVVSFGGPGGLEDIRPFLANVLRGRRVAPERVEAGGAPLRAVRRRLADHGDHQAPGARACEQRLARAGHPLPVYVGMRNWHPLLADTLRDMHQAGVRRAVGFIAAAQHSYSSCQQYRENVAAARAELRAQSDADVEVTFVDSWFAHPGFVAANAAHVRSARARLPAGVAAGARLVFTAHSIPAAMAERSRYREQLAESARLVAEAAEFSDHALVYQSRSGRPEDPWLGPDVCDYLARRARGGLAGRRSVSDRLRVRPHRGALRPRPRSGGGVPRNQACRWRAPKPSTTTPSSWT